MIHVEISRDNWRPSACVECSVEHRFRNGKQINNRQLPPKVGLELSLKALNCSPETLRFSYSANTWPHNQSRVGIVRTCCASINKLAMCGGRAGLELRGPDVRGLCEWAARRSGRYDGRRTVPRYVQGLSVRERDSSLTSAQLGAIITFPPSRRDAQCHSTQLDNHPTRTFSIRRRVSHDPSLGVRILRVSILYCTYRLCSGAPWP